MTDEAGSIDSPEFGVADLCAALLGEQTRVLARTLGLSEDEAAGHALHAMNRRARAILETGNTLR